MDLPPQAFHIPKEPRKMNYSIPGSNTLLVGATGTGKTHCLRTLIDCGITPFILFTEPGMRTLADLPADKCHWHYIPPAMPSFDDLAKSAKQINESMDLEALTKKKDWDKKKYRQYLEVMTAMNDFPCDRTGKTFGSVDTWGTDRALVLDSLSGLSTMAMDLAVGSKPVKAIADWGVAMDNLERILSRLCNGTTCHFIMIAHLEREKDEVTGSVRNMPSTLGNKLAPKIPRNFDDVVLCDQDGDEFVWRTVHRQTDLKYRNLARSEKLPPSFVPLIESWQNAGGIIAPREQEAS